MIVQKRRYILFLCVASLALPASALDLLSAYDAALSNDPTFRSAMRENEAGQANRMIGRSAMMPRLSGTYTQQSNDSKVNGPAYTNGPYTNLSEAYPSTNGGVNLTMPLFNLQAIAQYRQGMAQANQSQARFLYQTQDLLVRVAQAYTDLLYAQDQLQFVQKQKTAYQEQIKVNTRTFELGEGTLTDKLESLSAYELADAQVIESENDVENTKRKLEAIIGQPITSVQKVKKLQTGFKPTALNPSAFDFWKDAALASNPEILMGQFQIETARQEYLKNNAAHSPTVNFIAGWNIQKSNFVSSIYQNSNTTSAGLQLSLPIFSGGETQGRAAQAAANYEKSKADLDIAKERIITEVRKQFDAVSSGQRRIAALQRAVESATELTRAMRNSVRGGVRINLDILVAEKTLATAQRDLAQAKYNFVLSYLKLKQQAGNLTLEDLERTALNFQKD